MRDPALLLVDDTPENLVAVEAVLAPLGHRIVLARSGDEALRHLLTDDIGVIVLDVQMPGIDGFETARHIRERERTRDIPIVFLTAIGGAVEHRLRGYDVGAVDYLAKPVDPEILRAKVGVFLRLHLSAMELREQGALLAMRTQELERSNADLEQFSYVASHDLQEPLRAIAGYLEMLREELDGQVDEEARSWIDRASASAERMSTLIGDLLAYARAGVQAEEPGPVDLGGSLSRALEAVDALQRESSASIRHGDDLGSVLAVSLDLDRVLQNLLSNAMKYRAEQPPEIVVESERRGREVRVRVCDNGRGVAEEDLERVFGRFERVAGGPFPGTGLGLAVCRRIIERGGGRIWMERNDPNPGVTVTFTLPVAP